MPSVVRDGDGYRVGLLISWKDATEESGTRLAVYDATGTPMAAWRKPAQGDICALTGPLVTSARVWLGAFHISEQGGTQASWVAPSYDDVAAADQVVLPIALGNQGEQATDDVLALWGLGGNTVTIYDRLSNTAATFGGATLELKQAYPVGDTAMMGCYLSPGSYGSPSACIWSRSTQIRQRIDTLGPGEAAP
jgi:hypothetical protein